MQAVAVGGRIYSYGLYAHLLAGANNSQGNFTTVSYEYLFKHITFFDYTDVI